MAPVSTVILWFLLLTNSGCSGRTQTAEEEIRATLAAGETAAEQRSLTGLAEKIATGYSDEEGRSRKDLVRLLGAYLLAHQNIHLVTRIEQVTVLQPSRARIRVLLATAGTERADEASLGRIKADLHAVELILLRSGGAWQVLAATWHRAAPSELLGSKGHG